MKTIPLWIDGQAVSVTTARSAPVTNPSRGEVTAQVPLCGAAEIDRAVQSAKAAFPGWRDTSPLRRSRVMQRFLQLIQQHQPELARLVSEEHGKTLPDAMGSVQRGLEVVEFACGIPQLLKGEHAANVGGGVDVHSLRQPLGVCVGITPFNFPAMVPLWMFPMAIACGNSFVLKPSEKVPSCSLRLAELLKEAGLPDGVFNVVHGDKVAVDALLAHPDVAAVSFVGSTPVARGIYQTCAGNGKRVQALGGAKNHAVVLPDADLEFTADSLIGAAYGSAGERCMAISAVVAVGAVADPLVARLKARAQLVRVGASDAPDVEMGPLVTAAHRDSVAGLIAQGEQEGARLLLDGRGLQVQGHENGYFLGPTLFDQVSTDMTIYREEIFGPVLIVLRVDTLDQAIAMINANPYGNGTALFTASGEAARRFENEILVGMVGINVPIPVPASFFSFGGWKASLFGDLHAYGPEGVQFYTRGKVISSRWPQQQAVATGLSMPTP